MVRKVYTAKNGAQYIKLANGQCRFISVASKRYLNKIRKMRGGNPAAAAGAGAGADAGADDVIVIGDYEVKIIGVTEEKGNLTPRLIFLVKLNNPYIAYNGSIQEWFPFYLSSGHYSKGQSGMAQPFSGMIIQDFLQQGEIKEHNVDKNLISRGKVLDDYKSAVNKCFCPNNTQPNFWFPVNGS